MGGLDDKDAKKLAKWCLKNQEVRDYASIDGIFVNGKELKVSTKNLLAIKNHGGYNDSL